MRRLVKECENPTSIGPYKKHFGDETWQSSFDSSSIWAQKEHFITAGTDRSCSNTGAIDCLLLQVIGTFFFQAEDGIRDLTETGVQTCALPIFRAGRARDRAAERLSRASGDACIARQ